MMQERPKLELASDLWHTLHIWYIPFCPATALGGAHSGLSQQSYCDSTGQWVSLESVNIYKTQVHCPVVVDGCLVKFQLLNTEWWFRC